MASALEMLLPSLARLVSSSFVAFVAASFVPTELPTSSFTSSFAASVLPPFLSAADTDSAEGGFGFAAGADMFGRESPVLRGFELGVRAETEDGAA